MKNTLKRILSLALAIVMVLGMVPAMEAEASAGKESRMMASISTGDSTWVAETLPTWTKESIDALLDFYEDFDTARVYWRGLQNEMWNQTQYNLQNGIRGTYHSEGVRQQFLEFEAEYGMTIDEYFVQEAHKRGIEVFGTTSLADFGSGFDVPINSWPTTHNAYVRMENPDWVPKDKYGLVDQGGALEYSIKAVRDWYINLHVQEMEKVGYDGILFITYSENYSLNYNDQFGYSDEAVQEFYNRYGIVAGKDSFSRWASIYDWQRLRGEYLTQLFRELKAALNADGEEEQVALFLDPRDPWRFQAWSASDGILSDGIYQDLFTYVKEGIIDQFVCNGASSLDAQLNTIEDMIQLCEGTGTEVALYTSNASAAQWDSLKAQGIDVITYGSYDAMIYNRAPVAGDPATDEGLAVKLWLAKLAEGKTTLNLAGTAAATLEDITPYLFDKDENGVQGYKYNITVRRMAMHALKTLKLDGGSDAVEQVLLTDPEPGVQCFAADVLRYIGDLDSVDALIEAIYRYDEFATVEAAAVALYANVNKAAWQNTLRTAYATYAANDYNNGSDDNLRVCANILRALSSGGYNDLAFYQGLVETYGPNNNTEVLLGHDLADVQARQEAGKALAIMEDVIQEMWYDIIRYWATMGVANTNNADGFNALFELALGEDTITSTPALIALGTRASSGAMVGEYRTRALEILDTVFGQCGDGSTRIDMDWIYRPIGAALQKYGEDGVAVLEKYLNGDDKILALYAWRDLYIPWTPGSYNEMTTSQYEEAYLKLPDSLKEYTTQSLLQDWEDKSIYNQAVPASSNGYVGDAGTTKGRWGTFNAGGVEVSNFVREGSTGTNSLKMVRGGGTGNSATGTFPALTNGQAYKASLWVYRTKGGIFTINIRNAAGDSEVQAFIKEGGNMVFYDNDAKGWGSQTILTVPEDQWVQLTFEVSRLNGKITVSMTDEAGVSETASTKVAFNAAQKVDRVVLTMGTVNGGTAYFDDISIVTATPVRPERSQGASISMKDATVRYDGAAHSISATTNLMGDTVPAITYKNAYAADAVATTEAPVDAGTYLVTATAEYEGKTYTAEATLTIVPAIPTFDSSKVTATDIVYGQKLSESVLTMEEGALIGLIPADSETKYETVETVLVDQNFDDTTVFPADGGAAWTGSATTTVGRWIGAYIGSTAFSGSQAVEITRGKDKLWINMGGKTDVLAGSDYEMRYMLYFNGGKELSFGTDTSASEAMYYIGTDGKIYVTDYANSEDGEIVTNGLTIPTGQWVQIILNVDRSAGTYTVSYVTGAGTDSEKLHTGTSSAKLNSAGTVAGVHILGAKLYGDGSAGSVGFVDDFQIVTLSQVAVEVTAPELAATITWNNGGQYPVKKGEFTYTVNPDNKNYSSVSGTIKIKVNEPAEEPVYETVTTTVLEQDFEDTTLFNSTNTANEVGTAGTKAGTWKVTGGYAIVPSTVQACGSQSMALVREAAQQLYGTLGAALSKDADFEISYKIYRPNTMGFTFTCGEVSFYFVNNGQLKISNNSSDYDTYVNFSVPADQWIDVKIISDRANGNYTVTLTKADGTLVGTAASALYAAGSSAKLTFNAQGSSDSTQVAPYTAGYIDDVKIITTQVVKVDTTEYEKIVKLSQDFENLTFVQDANTTTSVSAGVQASTDGRWFRELSTTADTDLIVDQSGNKVLGIYRDATAGNKCAHVSVTDGIAAGEDFSVSFDYYSTAKGDMTLLMNGQYLFRLVAGGNIRLFNNGDFSSVVEMVAPTEEWINFRIDVAADGSFTVTMTDADGNETTSVNKGSISNTIAYNGIKFNNNSTVGLTAYIDNVELYRMVEVDNGPQYAYTQLMEQNFDNADIFALGNYNASNYLYPANFGGSALDGASFNKNGDIITLITEEDGSQYYRVRRLTGETGYQSVMTSAATAGLEACYEWSVDFKTDTGVFFTMGFGQGTYTNNEMSFIVGPDYIQSLEDTSKKLTFTQGEWTTIKFWADRDAGTYTFSVGDQSATVTTDLIGTIDVTRFSIWGRGGQENNNIYIDNVSFTKADVIPPYDIVDVVISGATQTYTGSAKSVSVSAGGATEYTVWYNGSTTAPTEAGTYEVQVLVTEDGYRGSATGSLTIEQAVPATTGEAVQYIEVAKGTTLADIDLGITFGTAGAFAWDGDATAALNVSGEYGWSFIPENSNYKSISGSVYVNVQGGEDAVAQVDETTYASLAMAIEKAEAGSTVTMIGNASEAGFAVKKSITVDFAGKSLSVTSGTITFAEGAVVELKSGTVAGSSMLLQNAADLTLTDMVLSTSGTAIYNGPDRALTVNYTYAPEAVTVTGGITVNGAANVSINGGIFTAAIDNSWCAAGYQAVQLDNGNWTVMDKDLCNAAKIGDTYYEDLAAAVEAAADGETVVMLRSADLGYLVLSGTTTLDLNGNTLSAPEGVITFAGQIIDSSDGKGAVITGLNNVILSQTNAQLPLYDSALGGYRFFSYSFKTLGTYTDTASGSGVYGLRLLLENEDGYALLGSADSGMTVKVTLTWPDMTSQAPSFTFGSDVMALYAGKIADVPAYALLVKVTGAEGLAVTMTPVIETVSRMGAEADPVTHTAQAAE